MTLPATLGIAGLGQMGLPIAAGLARQGCVVLAHDPDPARIALAQQHGVRAAAQEDVLAQPLVLSLLPSDAALQALCTAPGGLLARLPRGGAHVCLGTTGVALADTLAAAHAEAGQAFIACPVFGRPDEAWACDLTAVFGPAPGAAPQAVALARTAVACLAPRLHEVPSPAAACAAKLAGNQLIATAIAAMAEVFALAQAHGMAPVQLQQILTGKLFRGPVYEGVGRVVAGTVPPPEVPGFTVRLGLKDLDLCADAARATNTAMPVAAAVRERLARAAAAGHGSRDWAELPRLLPPEGSP